MTHRPRFGVAVAILLILTLSACGSSSARGPGYRSGGVDTVTVQRGDSVYKIAQRYGVSTRSIIDANGLRPPYTLYVGRKLRIPRAGGYRVRSGDTLYAVGRKLGVSYHALARANGLRPPYTIYVGQNLVVPRAGGQSVSQRSAPVEYRAPSKGSSQKKVASTRKPEASLAPPPRKAGGFRWPVSGKLLSGYGPKKNGLRNDGINIAAPSGTGVRAAQSGVVVYADDGLKGFGKLLLIKHDGGFMTAYAHNATLLVSKGQKVTRGQVVAKVGKSGNVTAPQLHFEIRKGRTPVDPLRYLPRDRADLSGSLDGAMAPPMGFIDRING
ncbi:MAG: LysM peptidoglycan-binding domain-containing protein [Magnetospiraceae bacterium]